ncbi:MAG TPA: hypothetical protein VLT45_13040, partial [Kofleriaceae bacterium]|nr:hypothetical protein [Kofleriaceae bacterium]
EPMPETMAAALVLLLQKSLDQRITFSSPIYRDDPERFARDILAIEAWARQAELLRLVRDYDRVACKSGRRVSKSLTAAILALWWFCSWENARVILTSTTARQVDEILWREVSILHSRAGRCVSCRREDPNGVRIPAPCPHSSKIGGSIGRLARTGLKSDDFREIVGFTARDAEAIQGIAGSRLLFIVDEASGIPQAIFDAIEGNRAGGGKVVLLGNPTRNSGEFFDAFHAKKRDLQAADSIGYATMTISSEESPNITAGREVIPGLATKEYLRERELEWGRESPLFRVHVLGEFATSETGAIFSVHAIAEAQTRWNDTPDAGRLYIGVDPAGPSGSGDDSVFVVRRGIKALALTARKGLSDEGHLVEIKGILDTYRLPRETPVLVVDREGEVGWRLFSILREYERKHPGIFELVGMRTSDRAVRRPGVYDRMRDELVANLEQWFRDGGSIPEDVRLAEELHALAWEQQLNGRLKVTKKDRLRKILGRSPDRFDALALSVWEPLSLREESAAEREVEPKRGTRLTRDDEDDAPLDPYGGRSFDPYRGGLR